jgi:hypothetical protein
MYFLKKALVFLFLPLLAFTGLHKFYLSVTQVNYDQEQESLQITSRLFIDDFENILKERYGFTAHLATPAESEEAALYIEKYIRSKFVLAVNGTSREYSFLGKRYDNDVMVCYLELTGVQAQQLSSISIYNDLLTDLFEDQKNIVHLTVKEQKKSFVLVKGDNKAMLNL